VNAAIDEEADANDEDVGHQLGADHDNLNNRMVEDEQIINGEESDGEEPDDEEPGDEEPDDDESDDDNYERGNAGVQNGDNDEGTSTDSEDDQSSDEEDPPSVPKEAAIRKRASTPDYLINHRFKKRVRVAR